MTSNYKAASERTDEAERLLTSAVPQTQRAQHAPPMSDEYLRFVALSGNQRERALAREVQELRKACRNGEEGLDTLLKLIPRGCDSLREVQTALATIVNLRAAIARAEGRAN